MKKLISRSDYVLEQERIIEEVTQELAKKVTMENKSNVKIFIDGKEVIPDDNNVIKLPDNAKTLEYVVKSKSHHLKNKYMENNKLIPLSDFVLEQKKRLEKSGWQSTVENSLELIFNYTEFLKQPLNLEMFTGENKLFEGFKSSYNGFSIDAIGRDGDYDYRLSFNKDGQCRQYYNIEELVNSDYPVLTLTPSALQQIGIKE